MTVPEEADVPNKAPIFFTVTSILLAVAFLLVVYRLLYSRMIRKTLSADDIVIGFSVASLSCPLILYSIY
jgi:multisubunit Na+/H+ antiporter MnhF subunit